MSETTRPAASRRALLAGALGLGLAAAVAWPSRGRRRTEAHGGGLHTHVDGVVHRHPLMVHEMGQPVARPVRDI
jgi:hypothetical protein